MAKIGVKYFRYSKLTEGTDTAPYYAYNGAKSVGKAISCNVSITNNDAKLFADDALAESDTSFQSGTATLGIDDEDLQTMADLLGHEYDQETNSIVRNANDTAPYVGFGRIITKMVGGVYKYKLEILMKVKFSEPSQDDTTKGESVEFGTTEIEGTISTLTGSNSGFWSYAAIFDDLDAAVTALETFFAAPTTETNNG